MLNDTAEFQPVLHVRYCQSAKNSGLALGALFGRITGSKEMILFALKRADDIGRTLVGSSGDFSACGKFVSEKELKSDDMLNNLNADGNQYIHDYLGIPERLSHPCLGNDIGRFSGRFYLVTEQQCAAKQITPQKTGQQVQKILADAADRIHQAADMEAVDAIRTETQTALKAIETLAGAQERKLQEAKEEAIHLLENYVDLESYRDEEKSEIQSSDRQCEEIHSAGRFDCGSRTAQQMRQEARLTGFRMHGSMSIRLDMAAATQVDSYIMNIGEVIYTPYVENRPSRSRERHMTV